MDRIIQVHIHNYYKYHATFGASCRCSLPHTEVARARAILGNAYRITGDFHSAVLQLEQSVDIYKAVKGVQHADTANAQILLGKAQRLAGQLGKSQRTLNEALKTQQEVLGKNHHGKCNGIIRARNWLYRSAISIFTSTKSID